MNLSTKEYLFILTLIMTCIILAGHIEIVKSSAAHVVSFMGILSAILILPEYHYCLENVAQNTHTVSFM